MHYYSTEMLISLVKEGIGVGWTQKNCIQKELENNELYEIPIEVELLKIEFSIAYDKSTIGKTAAEFAKYIIENVNENQRNC